MFGEARGGHNAESQCRTHCVIVGSALAYDLRALRPGSATSLSYIYIYILRKHFTIVLRFIVLKSNNNCRITYREIGLILTLRIIYSYH